MGVNNSLISQQQAENNLPFSTVINSVPYQKMISQALKDRNTANRFISSIVSAVATTPALQDCTPRTIVSAALLGEGLKLSPSPQLGQFYLVPFNDRKNGVTNATFVLGYKGYIQLATRSGEYKHINAMAIKEGELVKYNPFDDEIELRYIEDEEAREQLPTIGYYAMFEYHNGFKKVLYWSREKMEKHAETYSAGYKAHKGYTFWEKDFDGMACKTMLRQLISKWGLMSIEMQKAYEADGGIIGENGEITFAEDPEPQPAPQQPQPGNIIDAEPIPEPEPEPDTVDFADLMGG